MPDCRHRVLLPAASIAAALWGLLSPGSPAQAPAAQGGGATAPSSGPAVRIGPEDPASIQRGIEAAYRAGRKSIVIPAGTYRLAAAGGGPYLAFAEMADLEIDARGVTLLRTDPTRGGILFHRCRNVTLRGVTLVNETPPFTQGTIAAADPNGMWYDVRIERGYPANFDEPRFFPAAPTGYVFDPTTRRWKPGTGDFYCKAAERRGPGLFRLHFDRPRPAAKENVAVGDLMAFRGKGVTDIHLPDCAGMSIDGVTILSGGGFCIHESGGEGGSRYTYKVSYGPRPAGAATDPLIACNADAFHSSGVRRGPTLENCLFEGMPDDGVPIHGTYAMVMAAEGRTLVICTKWENFFRVGDPVRLFGAEGGLLGEAAVIAAAPARDYRPPSRTAHRAFRNSTNFHRLTLDRPLPAKFEDLLSTPAANGRGYVVRNNVIRNHRARGMLLKADDGVVEGNTVEGSTIAGIVIAPELWWGEACYSRNVVVRNNTVRRVGYATVGPWTAQAGAVTVLGLGEGKGDAPGRPGHRHVVIEGNTITDCDGVNLLIDSAEDVAIRGNRFVRPQQRPCDRGAGRGVDCGALVQLGRCRGVRFEANTLTEPGPALRRVFSTTPGAKEIVGLPDGIRR